MVGRPALEAPGDPVQLPHSAQRKSSSRQRPRTQLPGTQLSEVSWSQAQNECDHDNYSCPRQVQTASRGYKQTKQTKQATPA